MKSLSLMLSATLVVVCLGAEQEHAQTPPKKFLLLKVVFGAAVSELYFRL
jgi:hypothetical protein